MSRFDNILNRKLTRKDFLMTLGMSIVGLIGISSLLGILSGKGSPTNTSNMTYGSGSYGGDGNKNTLTKK
jgi:hypothetical protein